jgi:hypothetical protein
MLCRGRAEHWQVDNSPAGWRRLAAALTSTEVPRVGIEASGGLAELSRHFSCLPEHGCRLIGLVMKQHAQRELERSRPARRHDDTHLGPSLGYPMGQIRPAHRSGHAYVCEKQPDVCICFEEAQGLVGISGFEHPVSCIHEHPGCAQSLEYIVVDDHNEGVGRDFGHWRQHTLITIVPQFIRLSENTLKHVPVLPVNAI